MKSLSQLVCFIRTVWVWFDQTSLTVLETYANDPTTVITLKKKNRFEGNGTFSQLISQFILEHDEN